MTPVRYRPSLGHVRADEAVLWQRCSRLTVPLRREATGTIVPHALIHALLGVTTAVATQRFARRGS